MSIGWSSRDALEMRETSGGLTWQKDQSIASDIEWYTCDPFLLVCQNESLRLEFHDKM